ncbi:MAG: DUF4432 domain-containing protein [Desulfotalea sp.]|nr:MAG: DUF4432 domain-containing protein [Desulfotalea sp.]
MQGKIVLKKEFFTEARHRIYQGGEFFVETWRYASGIEALTIGNSRGHITVLPYMGQMIWDAVFDGVDLTMKNMFNQPLPSSTIIETYGCYLYHSGLLRNGCPGPSDSHPLHGEMPCAPMDTAEIIFGTDGDGDYLGIAGSYEYVMGFGDHYRAEPSIRLRPGSGLFDVRMAVTNLGGAEMELMYMCHLNPLFQKDAEVIQPMAYTAGNVITRTSIPGHVNPTPEWLDFLKQVAAHPEKMARLSEVEKYNPEFVFFLRNPGVDSSGKTHFLLKLKDGSSCYCGYSPKEFDHAVRWIMANPDQQVAAFVLPGTCEPEGYSAEKAKGNIKILQAGQSRVFHVRTGLLAQAESLAMEEIIQTLS